VIRCAGIEPKLAGVSPQNLIIPAQFHALASQKVATTIDIRGLYAMSGDSGPDFGI
jgi:hypothetical protein